MTEKGKGRKGSTIEPAVADVGIALLTGDSFFQHSQRFVAYLAAYPGRADEAAVRDIGGMVTSATNVALAIEIYLKALILSSGRAAPQTHELPTLWSLVPQSIQDSVDRAYLQLLNEKSPDAVSLELLVTRSPDRRPQGTRPPQSNQLKDVLARNTSAFRAWRYLFADPEKSAGMPLEYEFLCLSYIARALRGQTGVRTSVGKPNG
jgi:HEPN domain-containing protein